MKVEEPKSTEDSQLETNRFKLNNSLTIKSVDKVLVESAFGLYRGDELIAIATEKSMIEELKDSVITMAQMELCDEIFPGGLNLPDSNE